jgi:hypothetical protein
MSVVFNHVPVYFAIGDLAIIDPVHIDRLSAAYERKPSPMLKHRIKKAQGFLGTAPAIYGSW